MDVNLILLLVVVIAAVIVGNVVSRFINKKDKTDSLNKTDLREEVNQLASSFKDEFKKEFGPLTTELITNKTIIFGGRDSYSFGCPKKIEDNGFFWTAKYSDEELNRIKKIVEKVNNYEEQIIKLRDQDFPIKTD